MVRKYGYGPGHDTLAQQYDITPHFTTRYWNALTVEPQLKSSSKAMNRLSDGLQLKRAESEYQNKISIRQE